MQGYFSELYQFISRIIDNKDIVERIDIENTANYSKQFTNIVINVKCKHNLKAAMFWMGIDQSDEAQMKAVKATDAQIAFYHNRWKWECHGWQDLVRTLQSMYYDLIEVLPRNDINVPVYYNILGHNNYSNIHEDNFFDAKQDALEMDVKEFLEHCYSYDSHITVEELIKKHDQIQKDYYKISLLLNDIQRAIKSQKNAYLLSKLIDNKAARKDYEENETLVEAYDAYIDIKKLYSDRKYS